MRVEDPVGEGGEHGLGEHRAEAGHRHQVDASLLQCRDDLLGVGVTVEVLAERAPLDQTRRDASLIRHLEGAAGAVDHDELDGDAFGEDRLEQGAGAGCEDRGVHDREGTSDVRADIRPCPEALG